MVRNKKEPLETNRINYKFGLSGNIIRYGIEYEITKDPTLISKIDSLITESLEIISRNNLKGYLSEEFSDFGRVIFFLKRLEIISENDFIDLIEIIDSKINKILFNFDFKNNYCISNGILGIGHYYLEKIDYSESDLKCIYFIQKWLINEAYIDHEKQIAYWKNPLFNNLIYLGNFHGCCAILTFLINSNKLFNLEEKHPWILEYGINFLQLFIKQDDYSLNFIPEYVGKRKPTDFLSLTYGQLSILYFFVRNNIYCEQSLKIFENTYNKFNVVNCYDNSICYGKSGVILLFNNLYRTTGNNLFLNCQNFWIDKLKTELKSLDSKTEENFYFGNVGMNLAIDSINFKKSNLLDNFLFLK